MKIAYVCSEYPPAPHGGIGTFVQTMARAMVARGHIVSVVGTGDAGEARDDCGVQVTMLCRASDGHGVSGFVDRWRLHQWLLREAQAGRIEIVEVPDYAGLLPLPFRACPVAVRLHMSGTIMAHQAEMEPRRVLGLCERQMLRRHRNWIAVSKHVLALTTETFRLKPARATVIHNPATLPADNSSAVLPKLPDEFVLYAGTVCRQKGAYVLARAARQFMSRYPQLHLVYAGKIVDEKGTASDRRVREIVTEPLASRVVFLGALDRGAMAACMRRASLLAFPSQLEAFGLVAAEAMLAGIPVVVPNDGPFPEFVKHGNTGLMVPPRDPCALANAIEQILGSDVLRTRLGENAARDVRARCSVTRCAVASEEFYAALLASR